MDVDVAVAVAANVIVAALVSGNDTVGVIDIVDGQGPVNRTGQTATAIDDGHVITNLRGAVLRTCFGSMDGSRGDE